MPAERVPKTNGVLVMTHLIYHSMLGLAKGLKEKRIQLPKKAQ